MSLLNNKDIITELNDEIRRLTKELSITRERLKLMDEFKITFDLYSNKIKQSLDSNEWQKFENSLTKINEFVNISETSDNCVVNVKDIDNQKELQEVSHLSVGPQRALIILISVFIISRLIKS